MKQHFETKLVARGPGGAWTFLIVPFDVHQVFGNKSRVAVCGTINGFAYRNSIMPQGDGSHAMMVSRELQAGAKAGPGDTVQVTMEPDVAPRTVEVPEDFAAALAHAGAVGNAFARMSYAMKKEYVEWIVQAKKPETRARRIEKALEMVAGGKRLKA
jgi:hypothetical protein